MTSTPRSTDQLIEQSSADLKRIQDAEEFWRRMQVVRFSEHYHRALLGSGIARPEADEIAGMIRQYINRISDGLSTASYLLRELITEVEAASRHAGNDQATEGFRV